MKIYKYMENVNHWEMGDGISMELVIIQMGEMNQEIKGYIIQEKKQEQQQKKVIIHGAEKEQKLDLIIL